MSHVPVDCRDYRPEDRGACLDLLRRGHDPRFTEARFAWLHDAGPGGPSHKVVCVADGRVVGLYAVLPRPALLDGRPAVAGRDVDPVVDPEYRGRGLFTRMLDAMLARRADVDVLYNFANPASAPGFRKRGWSVVDALVDHAAQLGHGRLVSREGLLWAAGRVARPRGEGPPVVELGPAEVADLPEPLPPPGRRFAVRRTGRYFLWRYVSSPLHTYRILGRRDGGDLLDVVVVRADDRARKLVVVDLAAYRDDGGVLAAYLPALERRFGGGRVAVWSTVPAGWRRGLLRNPRARGLPLLARPCAARPAPALGAGDCFVTHGDVEAN